MLVSAELERDDGRLERRRVRLPRQPDLPAAHHDLAQYALLRVHHVHIAL